MWNGNFLHLSISDVMINLPFARVSNPEIPFSQKKTLSKDYFANFFQE
jgi:hypothetical protein